MTVSIALTGCGEFTGASDGPPPSDTASPNGSPSPDSTLWGVHELEFTGPSGLSNPFTDASGTVTFTGPSGQQYTVDMFYDGDGAGGQTGTVWKARAMPDEAGTWTWSSSSGQAELHGQTGTFDVSDQGLAAPFEVDPDYPHYLKRKTGERVFLVGDWLFGDIESGKVPLNHLAATLSDLDRDRLEGFHTERNLTLYSLYLNNRADLGHRVDPYVDSEGGDYTRYDLSAWHAWESELNGLRDAGLHLELWLHSDAGFDESEAEFRDFVTYVVARLAARPEVVTWVVGLEVDEYWSDAQRTTFAAHLASKDPYGKPRAVHHTPGPNDDRADSWLTYVPLQYGFEDTPTLVSAESEANRDVGKPLYAAEFAQSTTDDAAARKNMWTAFVSGAAMIGNVPGRDQATTDQTAKHFADYVNGAAAPGSRPEWWRMSPADSLVTAGEGYLLREADARYIAYLPFGGSVTIDLTETTGNLAYAWYNPRNGTVHGRGSLEAGGTISLQAPDGNDWILDLRGED